MTSDEWESVEKATDKARRVRWAQFLTASLGFVAAIAGGVGAFYVQKTEPSPGSNVRVEEIARTLASVRSNITETSSVWNTVLRSR